VIDAKSGRDLATLKIGKGPDGVLLDAARRRAFVPTADGNLTMISLKSASEITVARFGDNGAGRASGALDPATGALYLPTAKMAAPKLRASAPSKFPVLSKSSSSPPNRKFAGVLDHEKYRAWPP